MLDDIIVWWVDDERFDVMPNASNTDGVVSAIGGTDVTATRAILAVQGPEARARLGTIAPEAAAVPRFHVGQADVAGVPCRVAGTGYTGEDGVELAVPVDGAARVWEALLAAGIEPAGLGARDTLRLESGLPLHGHELGAGITPLQAGLGWVVAWDKPGGFRGREPLLAERERGVSRRLRGLSVEGRRPPRADQVVLVDGSRGRRRHQRQLLTDARARHRAGVPPPGRGGRRHGGASPPRATPPRRPWSSPPFWKR